MTAPEGVMSKIMKLLERANHPETPPHEAKLAEEMAERFMAQHMIERHEAEQMAKAMGNTVRKPIKDEWKIYTEAFKSKDNVSESDEFEHHVKNMMEYVLKHCGVRLNPRYTYATKVVGEDFGVERKATDYTRKVYQIVGFSEDIAYAERIWFNVFKTFVMNVNPQWDKSKSIDYNAYMFASAGVSWKQQVLLAETAGDDRIEWPWRYQGDDRNAPLYSSFQAGSVVDPGNEPWGRSIHKLRRACKKYSDDNKLPYPYAAGAKLRIASRNSFARSYRQTIVSRLDEIRRLAKEGADHVDSGKFALAVRDTAERVDEEFYRLFPEFDPEVQRRRREAEEAEIRAAWDALSPAEQAEAVRRSEEADRAWARAAAKGRRNYRAVREDPADRYDHAAWLRGQKAANSVNLRNDGEVKTEKKKEIQ